MRRIDSGTEETDKHGTGRDGFTEGTPGSVPPTALDANWFDAIQEEVCRAIELTDEALDNSTFNQLHRVVMQNDGVSYGAISGFAVTEVSPPSLNGSLAPGVFYLAGRKYVVTAAMIAAAGTESPRAYTANMRTYLLIRPDPADEEAVEFSVVESALTTEPLVTSGWVPVAYVDTDGTQITVTQPWAGSTELAVPMKEVGYDSRFKTGLVAPLSTTTGVADQEGSTLGSDYAGRERYFRRSYIMERYTRPLDGVGNGRKREWGRRVTVLEGNTTEVDLDYAGDIANSHSLGVTCIVHAVRTDVSTGQSKLWRFLRLFERDSGGTLTLSGSEIRDEVTGSGTADVDWTVTGSSPHIELDAGATGDWEFHCYFETSIAGR